MEDNSKTQWQELPRSPTIKRSMTTQECEYYRKVLVQSYKCADSDITHKFVKMTQDTDYNDPDINTYIKLVYRMKCVIADKPEDRIIYTIKVPIPENVQTRYTNTKKTHTQITM